MDQYNVISFTTNLNDLEKDMEDWNMLTYDEKKAANDVCLQRYNLSNENLYNYIKANIQNSDNHIKPNDSDYELAVKNSRRNENISLSEGTMVNILEQWRYNSTVLPIIEADITIDNNDPLVPPVGYTRSGLINDKFEKIQQSINSVKEDNGDIIIINDFLDDYHMDYTMDDLNNFFNKYNSLSYDHKMESDMISTSIWGKDVPSMYEYMKAKISNLIDPIEKPTDIELSPVDKELNNFKLELLKAQKDHDIVEVLRKRAQVKYNQKNRSLYENAVLEGFFDKITVKGKTYQQGMPEVTPFLTYDEYVNNPKNLDEKKINFVDPFTYVMNFKDKEHKIREELNEAYRNGDTDTLLSLGWNPVVEPNPNNLKYARQRQIDWMNEFCKINVYDLSKYSTELDQQELIDNINEAAKNGTMDLAPIYLVAANGVPILRDRQYDSFILRFKQQNAKYGGRGAYGPPGYTYYNDEWSDIGISFNPKLNEIYYFELVDDMALNSMTKGNLKEYADKVSGATIAVIVFFVPTAIRKRIKDSVEKYYIHQNGSTNAFRHYKELYFNDLYYDDYSTGKLEFLCGVFLNYIFLISDLNLNQIYTNTTEKVTTITSDKTTHAIMLFKGKAINYSEAKVRNNTNALLAFNNYLDLTFFKKGLVLGKKYKNNLKIKLLEEVYIDTDDEEVNKILKEMRSIFVAKNLMDSANKCKSLDDIRSDVESINTLLSECGYTDINKIQHLINELYNIKNDLKTKDAVDSTDIIESINNICVKYLSISEGGKI